MKLKNIKNPARKLYYIYSKVGYKITSPFMDYTPRGYTGYLNVLRAKDNLNTWKKLEIGVCEKCVYSKTCSSIRDLKTPTLEAKKEVCNLCPDKLKALKTAVVIEMQLTPVKIVK